ncbi:hypothetical protein WICMUC_002276 [Wickerhamomyces mucosus]|uniref:non-specific serine/threonine protein kinase n=1 Tax=Wickerhamomyces mucosus TaxID=1378264 RepID=A0A9P8TEU1_9ASCO|nr:hypothetical protein WICMUC_002276 [Wickerhamomyces mucosus]
MLATVNSHQTHSSLSTSNTIDDKIDEFKAYEHGIPLKNRYRKISNVQDGSYGKVSLAIDLSCSTKVAVKAMAKSISGVTAIFRHEISILKRLGSESPNICALLNYFETSTHYFIIFEYCANGDLYDYLKKPSNHLNPSFQNGSPVIFRQFLKELASAVSYSHSKKVFHRDIKPENILIDDNGSLKLTDWGLATVGQICFDPCIGTEKYLSPETFFKKRPSREYSYVCEKADYWSIGITVLYALFGYCPFKFANMNDKNFKKFSENPEHLYEIYPGLTLYGFQAIMKLLQLNPKYRSLDEFMEFILSDYNKCFTSDQENYINESFINEEYTNDDIFGMEEDLDLDSNVKYPISQTQDEVSSIQPSMNVTPNEISNSIPNSLPPSLIESEIPMGVSWDEMDDIINSSIKVHQVPAMGGKPNSNHQITNSQFQTNHIIKSFDFNWY